ncbi:MAG: M20 family metallopeptidase [Emergencia sp.]
MKYTISDIRKLTDDVFDEAVAFRRQLHMHPELSEQEVRTSRAICEKLSSLGISYESGIAGHGVSAVIHGKNREYGVGIRADIDALPLTEMVEIPFKSQNPGIMHACGHDIHTAILVGTAAVLNRIRRDLPGSVRLLFQPSEETVGGAKQMIDAGCLNTPQIRSILGLHVTSQVDAGSVEFIPGPMNAASTEFTVTVKGKSCHGAHPTDGIDALPPACAMVTNLQSVITRRTDPAEGVLITVGTFHSGTKENIISGEAVFSGMIRTLQMKNMAPVKEYLEQMCVSTAQAYGASASVQFTDSYPTLENDDTLLQLVMNSSREILGDDRVVTTKKPSLGADDFAYFCHDGHRGLYYNIGTRRPGDTDAYPIHSEYFDPDEECIRTGILTQTAAVLKIMEEESRTW